MGNNPIKNKQFITYVSLVSQANTKLFQVNPTLAAGDVKVSTDGGAEGNITTLPVVTPAGSKRVKITLSAAEMDGDNVQVTFSDAAGAEWADLTLEIPTETDILLYDGGIWIDSGAGNGNTVVGVDGIPSKPVSTLVAARTLADAIGIKKYYITNGSALTLAATHQWWEFVGIGRSANIINLGSQDIDNSRFHNLSLAGTQGGASFISLDECILTSLLSLRPQARNCWIAGNLTILSGTMVMFDSSRSLVPGQLTPELTLSAGVTGLNIRDNSGGWMIKGMTSDHTMSLETDGQVIFHTSCTGGNASLRGMMSITDNSGNVTITKDAVYNKQEARDAMKVAPTAGAPAAGSVDKHLDDIEADTQNIQSRIPATLVSGKMNSDATAISGSTEAADNLEASAETIVTGAAIAGTLSLTEMTTNLTEVTNDHYNGRRLIWTSGVLQDQATAITDYGGTTKKLTFTGVTEAPSIGDTFNII